MKGCAMRRSEKILLVGCCISVAVFGIGALNTHRLAARTSALEAQCEVSNLPPPFVPDKEPWKGDNLVCDPNDLDGLSPLKGIQASIVQAHSSERSFREWPLPVALVLLALSAVPWLWYAFLRRMAELRAAIGGNPPEE